MKKAKFVRAYFPKYGKYKELTYEYRGHEYTIQDFGMNGMALAEQHKVEQNRIDSIIAQEEWLKEHPATESAEEAFAFFWDYVNQ